MMTKSPGWGAARSAGDPHLIAYQTGLGPLDPGDRQIGQFSHHLWGTANQSDDIIVEIEPGVAAKSLPTRQRFAATYKAP
jgi:hypothetical protein